MRVNILITTVVWGQQLRVSDNPDSDRDIAASAHERRKEPTKLNKLTPFSFLSA